MNRDDSFIAYKKNTCATAEINRARLMAILGNVIACFVHEIKTRLSRPYLQGLVFLQVQNADGSRYV